MKIYWISTLYLLILGFMVGRHKGSGSRKDLSVQVETTPEQILGTR